MKIYEICFSPTGGTEKVSHILAGGLGSEPIFVDLSDNAAVSAGVVLTDDDLAVIAVPSYSGRVPATAAERIASIKANGAKAVIVAVYGNRAYEDTLVELQDVAENAGFAVVGAVAAIAEHSIARRYAAGRPDAEDASCLKEFGDKIKAKLDKGDMSVPAIPGNRPYREVGGKRLCLPPVANVPTAGFVQRNALWEQSARTMPRRLTKRHVSHACAAWQCVRIMQERLTVSFFLLSILCSASLVR